MKCFKHRRVWYSGEGCPECEAEYDARATAPGGGHELKTASSANGNAVAGESPDARDARWISVSERLPTHIHSVLMWVVNDGSVVRDSPYAEIGIYNDRRGKWQMNSGDNDIDVEVTHWQPLPKPPVDAAMGSPE